MASGASTYHASPKVLAVKRHREPQLPVTSKKKGQRSRVVALFRFSRLNKAAWLSLEAERRYRSEERAPIGERRPALQSIRRTLVRDIFGRKPDPVAIRHRGRVIGDQPLFGTDKFARPIGMFGLIVARRHPTARSRVGIEAPDARGLQEVKFAFQAQRWPNGFFSWIFGSPKGRSCPSFAP